MKKTTSRPAQTNLKKTIQYTRIISPGVGSVDFSKIGGKKTSSEEKNSILQKISNTLTGIKSFFLSFGITPTKVLGIATLIFFPVGGMVLAGTAGLILGGLASGIAYATYWTQYELLDRDLRKKYDKLSEEKKYNEKEIKTMRLIDKTGFAISAILSLAFATLVSINLASITSSILNLPILAGTPNFIPAVLSGMGIFYFTNQIITFFFDRKTEKLRFNKKSPHIASFALILFVNSAIGPSIFGPIGLLLGAVPIALGAVFSQISRIPAQIRKTSEGLVEEWDWIPTMFASFLLNAAILVSLSAIILGISPPVAGAIFVGSLAGALFSLGVDRAYKLRQNFQKQAVRGILYAAISTGVATTFFAGLIMGGIIGAAIAIAGIITGFAAIFIPDYLDKRTNRKTETKENKIDSGSGVFNMVNLPELGMVFGMVLAVSTYLINFPAWYNLGAFIYGISAVVSAGMRRGLGTAIAVGAAALALIYAYPMLFEGILVSQFSLSTGAAGLMGALYYALILPAALFISTHLIPDQAKLQKKKYERKKWDDRAELDLTKIAAPIALLDRIPGSVLAVLSFIGLGLTVAWSLFNAPVIALYAAIPILLSSIIISVAKAKAFSDNLKEFVKQFANAESALNAVLPLEEKKPQKENIHRRPSRFYNRIIWRIENLMRNNMHTGMFVTTLVGWAIGVFILLSLGVSAFMAISAGVFFAFVIGMSILVHSVVDEKLASNQFKAWFWSFALIITPLSGMFLIISGISSAFSLLFINPLVSLAFIGMFIAGFVTSFPDAVESIVEKNFGSVSFKVGNKDYFKELLSRKPGKRSLVSLLSNYLLNHPFIRYALFFSGTIITTLSAGMNYPYGIIAGMSLLVPTAIFFLELWVKSKTITPSTETSIKETKKNLNEEGTSNFLGGSIELLGRLKNIVVDFWNGMSTFEKAVMTTGVFTFYAVLFQQQLLANLARSLGQNSEIIGPAAIITVVFSAIGIDVYRNKQKKTNKAKINEESGRMGILESLVLAPYVIGTGILCYLGFAYGVVIPALIASGALLLLGWSKLPQKENTPNLQSKIKQWYKGIFDGEPYIPENIDVVPEVLEESGDTYGESQIGKAVRDYESTKYALQSAGVSQASSGSASVAAKSVAQTPREILSGISRPVSLINKHLRETSRSKFDLEVLAGKYGGEVYLVFLPKKIEFAGIPKDILKEVERAEEKVVVTIKSGVVAPGHKWDSYHLSHRSDGLRTLGALADIVVDSNLGNLTSSVKDTLWVNDYFYGEIASGEVKSSGVSIEIVGDSLPYAGFNSVRKNGYIHTGDYPLIEKYVKEIESVMQVENPGWVLTPERKRNIEARLKEYFMLHELYELDGLILTDLYGRMNDNEPVPMGMVALYASHLNASEEYGGFNEYPPMRKALEKIGKEVGKNIFRIYDLTHAQGVAGVPEISVKYDAHWIYGSDLDERIKNLDGKESTKSITAKMTKSKVYLKEEAFNPVTLEQITDIQNRFEDLAAKHGESTLKANRELFLSSEVFYLIKTVATLQDKNDRRYKQAFNTLFRIINVVDGGSLEEGSLVKIVLELFESHYPGIGENKIK